MKINYELIVLWFTVWNFEFLNSASKIWFIESILSFFESILEGQFNDTKTFSFSNLIDHKPYYIKTYKILETLLQKKNLKKYKYQQNF